jgi:hypothetical protein
LLASSGNFLALTCTKTRPEREKPEVVMQQQPKLGGINNNNNTTQSTITINTEHIKARNKWKAIYTQKLIIPTPQQNQQCKRIQCKNYPRRNFDIETLSSFCSLKNLLRFASLCFAFLKIIKLKILFASNLNSFQSWVTKQIFAGPFLF